MAFIANDWHTALLPVYLKAYYRDNGLMQYTRSILVIHNIAHQVCSLFNILVWNHMIYKLCTLKKLFILFTLSSLTLLYLIQHILLCIDDLNVNIVLTVIFKDALALPK